MMVPTAPALSRTTAVLLRSVLMSRARAPIRPDLFADGEDDFYRAHGLAARAGGPEGFENSGDAGLVIGAQGPSCRRCGSRRCRAAAGRRGPAPRCRGGR